MNASLKELEMGCYTIRGPDTETALIGPITAQIIDADRLVRLEFRNGFPNWMLYRTALAGDSIYLPKLKYWAIAFTWVVLTQTPGIRVKATDELVGVVALDALAMIIYNREVFPYSSAAQAAGVHHKTYKALRNLIYRRLKASLDEYWLHLICAYSQVKIYERKC